MNKIIKLLFMLVALVPLGKSAHANTPLDQAALLELLKDPKVVQLMAVLQKIKIPTNETMAGNLRESCQGFTGGLNEFGLAVSRVAKYGAQNFNEIGKTAAKHYCLFGLSAAGALWFYWYVWPYTKVKFSMEIPGSREPQTRVLFPVAPR